MYAQNIIQEKIVAPAMKDETFRQRLLSSPKMVLERELGITLPQEVNVQVHEETPAIFHFVLPQRTPSSELWELDAAELERTYAAASTEVPYSGSCYGTCETESNMTYTDIFECCCDNETNAVAPKDRKM